MAAHERHETTTRDREARAATLFDLRRVIGGLFVLYGIVLVILGIGDSDAEISKAAGVHINLWAGLGMLVLGLLFLLWAFTRPLGQQIEEVESSEEAGRGTRRDRERAPGERDTGLE